MKNLKKLYRYITIYGLKRSIYKVAGRMRTRVPFITRKYHVQDIGVIGCGQFAFSTIGFFIQQAYGRRIAICYDIDSLAKTTFARALNVSHQALSVSELLEHKGLRIVYIASNHASHADYAIEAIRHGLDVYIEKPVSVNHEQLVALLTAIRHYNTRIYAGYNRPFSSAIRMLRDEIKIEPHEGFSIQCFVSGHKLGPDHWYRRPEEGTRVCGNVGHWIDLAVHILSWRGMPDEVRITLAMADESERDDNIVISFNSDLGDIFSIMLTSRCEPFEGINETINIQHANTICKIDDFRRITIWRGDRIMNKRIWPKDVGHHYAILQPFRNDGQRDWNEVIVSTLIMLQITDMVINGCMLSTFSIREALSKLPLNLTRSE